jgi:hypothetical protein
MKHLLALVCLVGVQGARGADDAMSCRLSTDDTAMVVAIQNGLPVVTQLSSTKNDADVFLLEALRHHATRPDAPYAVRPIALAGGSVPNLAHAGWLVYRNKSWGNFIPVWPQNLTGTIMGVLWMGSVAAYGTATTLLGVLGASIGWSIYQISMILTANISGWIAGEWKGTTLHSKYALWSGLFLLGFATVAITYGNH